MKDPLESFHQLYNEARRSIEAEDAARSERAVAHEKQQLDEAYEYEILEREAIKQRRITLNLASSVAILLRLSNVKPEHWIEESPQFEQRGWLKKREVQVGTLSHIALEGWKLQLPQNEYLGDLFFTNFVSTKLILTADKNTNQHPPLVWYRETSSLYSIGRHQVNPLPQTPLIVEDMPWARPADKEPSTQLKDTNTRPGFVLPVVPSQRKAIQAATKPEQKADYDLYRDAGVENSIRKALAQLAAEHGILTDT